MEEIPCMTKLYTYGELILALAVPDVVSKMCGFDRLPGSLGLPILPCWMDIIILWNFCHLKRSLFAWMTSPGCPVSLKCPLIMDGSWLDCALELIYTQELIDSMRELSRSLKSLITSYSFQHTSIKKSCWCCWIPSEVRGLVIFSGKISRPESCVMQPIRYLQN